MSKIRKGLEDLFGLCIPDSALERAKERLASYYESTCSDILKDIISSPIIHIDETTVKLRKTNGYVWVLTSLDRVYYLYRPSRETEFLKELLSEFRGVLISDFYTGYDSLPCEQQKCLVHLVRDIDDDLLRNPLDEELKSIANKFGGLLRIIIDTVDRFGLRKRNLRKHRKEAGRFLELVSSSNFVSDLAKRYQGRFDRHGEKMFTFLEHDGVPWNNNNAEHAIKRFVKYRRENDGRYSERTLGNYLIFATVFETCAFNNLNILEFLLSGTRMLDDMLHSAGRS